MDLRRALTIIIEDADDKVLGYSVGPSGASVIVVPIHFGGMAVRWLIWDGEDHAEVALRPPVLLEAGSKVTVDVVHVSFAWGPTTLDIEAAVAELAAMAATLGP